MLPPKLGDDDLDEDPDDDDSPLSGSDDSVLFTDMDRKGNDPSEDEDPILPMGETTEGITFEVPFFEMLQSFG